MKVGGKTFSSTRLCANACRAIYFYVNWTLISIGYTNGSNIRIQAYYRCTSTTHLFTRVYKNYWNSANVHFFMCLLEYSIFNSGNNLKVHMDKYVPPPNINSDFKFPASHLLLQQLRQVQMSQCLSLPADARAIRTNVTF